MYIIAGLGNPGLRYRGTRHNAGFMAVDELSKRFGIPIKKKEKNALTGSGTIEGERVLLIKPQTYMNKSGEAIGALSAYYGVAPDHVVVLSDDVMQDCGGIRIRRSGSAGGHNGLKNIIAHLGTEDFPRVRIGVGRLPAGVDMIGHVLGHLRGDDKKQVLDAVSEIPDAVRLIISGNIDKAMNDYNGKK